MCCPSRRARWELSCRASSPIRRERAAARDGFAVAAIERAGRPCSFPRPVPARPPAEATRGGRDVRSWAAPSLGTGARSERRSEHKAAQCRVMRWPSGEEAPNQMPVTSTLPGNAGHGGASVCCGIASGHRSSWIGCANSVPNASSTTTVVSGRECPVAAWRDGGFGLWTQPVDATHWMLLKQKECCR